MTTSPLLLVADKDQHIFERSDFLACGQSGNRLFVLSCKDLIPLPQGSNMFFLPDRHPVGFHREKEEFQIVEGCSAVAAFIPPGYTQLLTPAYQETRKASLLPLFSYVPVAYYKGGLYVPAVRVDRRKNHDLCALDPKALCAGIKKFRKTENRLIQHLAGCAKINSCPNAINFFLGQYEAPLPVSPTCNARCLGCISSQPKNSCPATQPRLQFVPTPEEIAEIALHHIQNVFRAVVSFGQGCEGEPLTKADVIQQAIRLVRQKTNKGTIHMNTNGSLPSAVDRLCQEGLDSLRVSLNSAQPELYHRYYSPQNYSWRDVVSSILTAKRHGKFVALNYLVMPGLTDSAPEFRALKQLVRKTRVDMIQWRNLNYDPQRYFSSLDLPPHKELPLGIQEVMRSLRKEFPRLHYGYFNLPKEQHG